MTTVAATDIDTGAPSARLVLVTPETARRWLARNVSNRNIRKSHVAGMAADMVAGLWQITGEAIKFDDQGRLIDGQHRLTAIADSGVSVNMLVVSGLRPEAQQVMDSGAKRNASDALAFAGRHNTVTLAAAGRLALAHEQGALRYPGCSVPNFTHSQIVQFVDLNPDLETAISLTGGWRLVGISRPAATAAALRLLRIDAGAARAFVEDVMESRTNGRGDPRAALIHRLNAAKNHRELFRPSAEMWCIFRAWNAVRAGDELKHIKFNSTYSWVDPQ